MVRLLATDHLNGQWSALPWLRKPPFIQAHRIAVAGNSFGGIETALGAERGSYCAAVAFTDRRGPPVRGRGQASRGKVCKVRGEKDEEGQG